LLAQFRLAEHANRPTRELPYGKRRLLEIGLAVALRPSVLLLDEPAAGVPGSERRTSWTPWRRCRPTCRWC
jgi:branched-chain amino acid transport system ATP-binding protein